MISSARHGDRLPASPSAPVAGWRTDLFLRAHAGRIVAALCAFAAIRIFFFAAAFPLFNITDEGSHFLAIRMFAAGHLPRKQLPPVDPEFARTFILYWSPEYTHSREDLARYGPRIPLYQLPPQARQAAYSQAFYAEKFKDWSNKPNFEAQAPPLYYIIAGGWYDLGFAFGIRSWGLAYWVRFLNPVIYALLVLLGYKFVRKVYPERVFLVIAVPALIAIFPQDVFFGMNRDVLSAPLTAAALLLMMKALDEPHRYWSLLLGSLLVGLTFLVEVSNCVLFGVLAATFWFWIRRPDIPHFRKIWVVNAGAFAALAPPLLWMVRNYLIIGDLTGFKAKMHELTWTIKPFAEVFHHPLFSWDGLSYFLLQLTRTFWHGEYLWHGRWMRLPGVDWFYVFSSLLMIVLFSFDLVRRQKAVPFPQQLAGFQALFLVAGSVLFLAAISLPFDFHDCIFPSRLHPFFISGRIISGTLLPFVLIYASGLELVLNWFRRWIPPVVGLLYLMVFITTSEIVVRKPAFFSPYNFFSLSAWPR